jgi:hypothetical protein
MLALLAAPVGRITRLPPGLRLIRTANGTYIFNDTYVLLEGDEVLLEGVTDVDHKQGG